MRIIIITEVDYTINILSQNITASTESTLYKYLVFTSLYFWYCYRGLVSRDRGIRIRDRGET